MTPNDRPTVVFVLSGGASLGAIQVGMLRALDERGIAPDVIVGTSAGAMNGAFIASGPQTVATADALAAACLRPRGCSHAARAVGHLRRRRDTVAVLHSRTGAFAMDELSPPDKQG